MRIRAILLIVIVLIFSWAPARAQSQVVGGSNGRIDVTDSNPGVPGAPAERGGGGGDRQVYSYWAVSYVAGGFCRERRYTYDQAEAAAYNYAYRREAAEANGVPQLAECPTDAGAPAPPTPEQLARDFWATRQLPSPSLDITPDYAVSGKQVYLQITGPKATTFHVDNPLGPAVDISATSRYVVDWGDGTPPTTTNSQGGPWPDGDVTHVYDRAAGTVTIRVTQRWSATWTAEAGPSGTLDDLQTGSTLTLRVEQVQPVRNR